MQGIDDPKSTYQAAQAGDIDAQMLLGKLLIAQEKYDEASNWLRQAATAGQTEAQCLYGSLFSEGLGVDQDAEQAAYWLRLAAEQGHSGAQILLAESFISGNGVPVNHAIALQWYRKAAEQGDNIAQYRYGALLRAGNGVPQDLPEAMNWLKLAAEAGCNDATVELALCLSEMPDADPKDVRRWTRQAGESGDAVGQCLLAKLYENSRDHFEQEEAVIWYRRAAENGSGEAQMKLGKLYAEGKVVAKDAAEAERWLNMVVEGDSAKTMKNEAAESAKHEVAPHLFSVQEYTPGSIIDSKYFILSVLGRGGMCMVYKAKHMLMNKTVALKMLLPESAADKGLVERFRREAQAASSLQHPNIITVYDMGISPDGKPFMVLDYLEGHSLEQRIQSAGFMPAYQVISIFAQVTAALAVAHEAGIVHRDIKPSNVMLTESKAQKDFVKVVDFGLAKQFDNAEDSKLTKTGEVFGTLMYMSPEQCLGHPLDPRTDIYSVGCTMFETLTGTPVFRASTPYDFMNKHINIAPPRFDQVAPHLNFPPGLEEIVLKMLAKSREDRQQSMSEINEQLMQFLN